MTVDSMLSVDDRVTLDVCISSRDVPPTYIPEQSVTLCPGDGVLAPIFLTCEYIEDQGIMDICR